MSSQTPSAPTQPHLSMSTNTNARNPSTSSPVKTYHKTPGSNGMPMSSVLLQKGITHKTASTARKSASIGNAESPVFSAKATSALRRPSEDHSSDSTSSSRGKNTSLSAAGPLSTTKSAQAAKKRKRVPFYYSEDEMVRSDFLSTRPGKISGSTLGSGTVVDNIQSSVANSNSSPAASHSPDVVTMVASSTPLATDPKIPRTLSGPTVVDLDPPDATSTLSGPSNVSGIPKESDDRLRPMKKKQRTVQSTLSFSRPGIIPSEVITIDSDDEELSPEVATQTPTPVALVEAAGEAAIMPSGEVRSNTHAAPRPSSFTQRVRNIKERLSLGSEAAKTPLSRTGTTPDAKPLLTVPEIDAEGDTTGATGDTVECPIPANEAHRIEEKPQEGAVEQLSVENETILPTQPVPSISTPMPTHGSTTPEDKETGNEAEKIPESLEHSQADAVMQDLDMQDVPVSAEEVESLDSASLQRSTAEQAVFRDAPTETQSLLEERVVNGQAENCERPTDDCSKSGSASSHDSVDKTPPQSHQSVVPVELDRNMPGVRGRVVREYMDLEDKYARKFRAQAWLHPHDRTYVNHDFFSKCINPLSIPREELECMVHKLENTIFILYEEASQYIISQQFYRITPGVLLRGRIDDYFLSDRLTLSLDERLRKLVREITVMTFSHSKIMFQAWVAAGQQPLEGKIVLSTESILELVENHKRISSEIEQDDKIAGANGKEVYNIDHDPAVDADAQRNNPGQDPGEDHTRDLEMTDAVGEAVDNLNRRNSLIIKLSAPPTILRELDRSKASLVTSAAAAQAPCVLAAVAPSAVPPTAFTFTVPPPAAQTLNPPRLSKPNARAKLSKSKESGVSHITSIMEQMNHFGSSRMDQINVTTKERHDPYLRRIRQLDQEKEKIRLELRQLTEESARKTAEYDKQLTLLLHEADFLDQEAKLNGLGPNGYLPPERDLKWDLYERLHREKADHETDTAAAKEKLIRRGHSINEEKRRAHVFYQENLEFEQSIEARKKEFEQALLMNPCHSLGASSYASSSNSTPSTREPSAAVGAVADRPATEGVPADSSESSGPSSIFSEEAASTPATAAPDRSIINKAAAFRSMRSIFENNLNGGFGSGYGNMLLIGIRDAAMLEVGEAPPASRTASQLLAADAARKKKKRPVKGW